MKPPSFQRSGDPDSACDTYKTAFELADAIGDVEMKARAARNLGIAYRDSGDFGSASKYLLMALQLYEALDQRVGVVQTQWTIARLALAAGNALQAVQQLPRIVDLFGELDMAADLARAQLDLAEALLILGRFGEVEKACAFLVAYFRRARMLTGALTAAAFLKEAAEQRTITREHLASVRSYLARLERNPDLLFVPPPSAIN